MKRTWLLAVLCLLLGVSAFFSLRHQKQTVEGSYQSPDMAFAVTDPADINKIFIADRAGQTATLERKDGYWLYNGKYKARPTAIENLLETVTKLQVQTIPTKGAETHIVKSIATEGIKVELYGKGNQRLKTYYVGGVTNDERGTYMMMEDAERPYVMHLPGFIGQLRVRYLLGDDNWRDRAVFEEKPEEIQSVSVEYPQRKNESFHIEKTGPATFEVKPLYSTTPAAKGVQRKGLAEGYLLQFEKKIAEAFETDNPLRDSVTALVPFAVLTVKKTDGQEKQVRFWPVEVEVGENSGKTFVQRYFTDCSWGAFMLTQDQVIGPLFKPYSFFFEDTGKAKLSN